MLRISLDAAGAQLDHGQAVPPRDGQRVAGWVEHHRVALYRGTEQDDRESALS
jgi:hypothetical protein